MIINLTTPILILIIIIFFLILLVGFLLWIIIRREKSLELIKFSISNTGIQLAFELDRDKKMNMLALEIRTLKSEIEALKAKNNKIRWQSFLVLLIMVMINVLEKLNRVRK